MSVGSYLYFASGCYSWGEWASVRAWLFGHASSALVSYWRSKDRGFLGQERPPPRRISVDPVEVLGACKTAVWPAQTPSDDLSHRGRHFGNSGIAVLQVLTVLKCTFMRERSNRNLLLHCRRNTAGCQKHLLISCLRLRIA